MKECVTTFLLNCQSDTLTHTHTHTHTRCCFPPGQYWTVMGSGASSVGLSSSAFSPSSPSTTAGGGTTSFSSDIVRVFCLLLCCVVCTRKIRCPKKESVIKQKEKKRDVPDPTFPIQHDAIQTTFVELPR